MVQKQTQYFSIVLNCTKAPPSGEACDLQHSDRMKS